MCKCQLGFKRFSLSHFRILLALGNATPATSRLQNRFCWQLQKVWFLLSPYKLKAQVCKRCLRKNMWRHLQTTPYIKIVIYFNCQMSMLNHSVQHFFSSMQNKKYESSKKMMTISFFTSFVTDSNFFPFKRIHNCLEM